MTKDNNNNSKQAITEKITTDQDNSSYGMTTSVKKDVKQTQAGSYCIYVPYKWSGMPTLAIFQDEDYSILAVPEEGRIPIKVSDYQMLNPSGKVVGKKVWALPVSEVLNVKAMVERALPILSDKGVKEKLKELEEEEKRK